ncbi:response regulator [Allohahella sp. A8]|uniref:response regulator n=1 Tax=Allohahella sp. A8 TaxID=3141461 RepID=UPI000C0B8DE8|nr:DNA-binding response regulator [Hahellaceae bacterium]|tara:strand:+ start:2801 stop:3532 length:732 start_codon:yes stop_codon:yes gene_type:complete
MTIQARRILVVDDDAEIRELLTRYLNKNGFDVESLEDGAELSQQVRRWKPDLLILDIMLPGEDGLAICHRLRKESDLPVLMLTANAEETDRIVGLEMGADDYLAKPFNPRELLARIKAILRRSRLPESAARVPVRYHFDGRQLEVRTRTVIFEDGHQTMLTGADFKLLMMFLQVGNDILERDHISEVLHSRDCGPYDRSIDVSVSRLRQRLEDNAKSPELILTHRGVGYVLAANVRCEYDDGE